ncbi:hypothetical protein [Modestobacter roseus]|uniref:Uncharacterized protein n=1 Tax=Modestobacter roseus TaxID=1181884 RepID=A0A562IQ63_9ACTN|nr:hypothetical protein [Modestobacter roseus]MQA34573.1 hypothetical protein [Modestobacter roseus]TWH72875.1 hypothetical protein JD78_01397 [Modestobacter roseus]
MSAWVALVVILLGLPLLAWWVSRRRMWSRLRPSPAPDTSEWRVRRDIARRHELSPRETGEMESAVDAGRAVDDPRLRAATVEWARYRLDARATQPRWIEGRWLPVLLIAWGAGVVAHVVFAVAEGRWGDVNWLTAAAWVGWAVFGWRSRSGPQRALERNSGPPSTGQRE